MNYLSKHTDKIYITGLCLVCLLLFCVKSDSYPFIDTDETKFVSIAKDMLNCNDWLNIKLNGENIFDLPPLFFWLANLSCLIFGKISSEALRAPVSLISSAGIIILYLVLKNILSKTYAFITAMIMASNPGIIIFSRLATTDIIFCTMMMCSILFAYLSIFSENKAKTSLYWILIYVFSALAVLSGGLFGILIPLIAIPVMYIFAGNVKEIVKPRNFAAGLIIFMILVLPWFCYMVYGYGGSFIKANFSAVNFFRTAGLKAFAISAGLFILLFMPWVFSFFGILSGKLKDIIQFLKLYFKDGFLGGQNENRQKQNKTDKFLLLNLIFFFTAAVFALLWGIKHTFLILLLIFPSSCLTGHCWYEYITEKKHDKSIFYTTIIFSLILIICSLTGLFGTNTLNKWLFEGLNRLIIPLVIIFFVIPVISIFAVLLKGRLISFAADIVLMISLSFVLTPSVFNFLALNSGENDLITFAARARNDKALLSAFIPSKKYSLSYYYDKPVLFHDNKDIEWLKNFLNTDQNAYVVVEIKDLWTIEDNQITYMLLDSGKRYCLIKYMPYEQQNQENTNGPKMIIY